MAITRPLDSHEGGAPDNQRPEAGGGDLIKTYSIGV